MTNRAALSRFVGDYVMRDWLLVLISEIDGRVSKVDGGARAPVPASKPAVTPALKARPTPAPAPAPPVVADLLKLEAHFDIDLDFGNAADVAFENADADPLAFHQRSELVR